MLVIHCPLYGQVRRETEHNQGNPNGIFEKLGYSFVYQEVSVL